MDRQIYRSSYGILWAREEFLKWCVCVCVCVCVLFFKAEVKVVWSFWWNLQIVHIGYMQQNPWGPLCLFFFGVVDFAANKCSKQSQKQLFQVLDSWQLLRMNRIIHFSWQDGCYASDLPWYSAFRNKKSDDVVQQWGYFCWGGKLHWSPFCGPAWDWVFLLRMKYYTQWCGDFYFAEVGKITNCYRFPMVSWGFREGFKGKG